MTLKMEDTPLQHNVRNGFNWLVSPDGQQTVQHWYPYLIGGALLFALLMGWWSMYRPLNQGKHLRGVRLVTSRGAWLKRLLASRTTLLISGVRWPHEHESLNLLLMGSPGTGKSQTLQGMMPALRARGESVLIADAGGDALSRFGQAGDWLLNPFDARSVQWSPFAEMDTASDADRLAKSMIPDRDGEEREWFAYSQTLVAAVLRRLWENGNATNESMLHALTMAAPSELKQLVNGLPAQALFHEGAERMLGSVRGIIGSYLASYSYLKQNVGAKGFSIRRYVHQGQRWLWLPYREDQGAALRPLITTWIGEAVNAALSLPLDTPRRQWLLLDEVASLGRVQGLKAALSTGRKSGVCAIFGVQSIAQLHAAYGKDDAQTLLSCLSSQLFLGVNDPDTAEYASGHMGDHDIELQSVTQHKDGKTTTWSRHSERLVLASELQSLKSRRGYVRLGQQELVQRVTVPLIKRPVIMEAFKPRTPEDLAPLPTPPPVVVPKRPLLDADAILNTSRQ